MYRARGPIPRAACRGNPLRGRALARAAQKDVKNAANQIAAVGNTRFDFQEALHGGEVNQVLQSVVMPPHFVVNGFSV